MRIRAVSALAADNVRQNRLFFLAAFLGATAGAAVLLFFLSLHVGVQENVVKRFFRDLPETRLKVSAADLDFGLFGLVRPGFLKGSVLDDDLRNAIRERPGVLRVYAEDTVRFPIRITGSLFGRSAASDLVATGLAPEILAEDLQKPDRFQVKEGGPLPAVVSRRLLDLYNGAFAPMNGFPKMKEGSLLGFRFDLVLGKSYLGGRAERGRVRRVQCELVGFSDKAVAVGVTLPLETVRAWNREFAEESESYSALYADLQVPEQVSALRSWLEAKGYHVQTAKDGAARQASEAVNALTGLFLAISVLILGLSALNLAFLLALMVHRRAPEIGLWRAMGATRGEMAVLVLLEAGIVGAAGGVLGSILGVLGGLGLERLLSSFAIGESFSPEALFAFPPWIFALTFGLVLSATLLGAFFPALMAAKTDPVQALRSRSA